jgi:hypothetical protein
MDFMDQILEEVEALAIANAEKGVAPSASDVALETFFDGAEDLNTPANRTRVHLHYNIRHRQHRNALAAL